MCFWKCFYNMGDKQTPRWSLVPDSTLFSGKSASFFPLLHEFAATGPRWSHNQNLWWDHSCPLVCLDSLASYLKLYTILSFHLPFFIFWHSKSTTTNSLKLSVEVFRVLLVAKLSRHFWLFFQWRKNSFVILDFSFFPSLPCSLLFIGPHFSCVCSPVHVSFSQYYTVGGGILFTQCCNSRLCAYDLLNCAQLFLLNSVLDPYVQLPSGHIYLDLAHKSGMDVTNYAVNDHK